jgi:hypothetical protein
LPKFPDGKVNQKGKFGLPDHFLSVSYGLYML